jgi:predicted transcriptional regulator
MDSVDLTQYLERLGRTKKRILIELSKNPCGYKKLAKTIGVGLDTVRSHVRTGKYSTSLVDLGLVEKAERGWNLTETGKNVANALKDEPELKAFFYD